MAFTTSGKRSADMSVRLKAENYRNLKNAREETANLEIESKQMEARLQELKLAMMREKEGREKASTGYWKTGQLGSLSSYGTEAVGKHAVQKHKDKTKKKNVVVLKDEPIAPADKKKQPAVPGTLAYIAQKGRGATVVGPNAKGPKCGQCEEKAAHVSCQECGEDYCAQCFASFHMKGALKKHRSNPIGSASTPRTPRALFDPSLNRSTPQAETNGTKRSSDVDVYNKDNMIEVLKAPADDDSSRGPDGPSGGPAGSGASLLDGHYDEADAAREFQEALRAWRQPATDTAVASIQRAPVAAVEQTDHSTGTEERGRHTVEVTFTSQLSYAERLLLKRHRREQLPPLSSQQSISGSSTVEDEKSDVRSSLKYASMDFDDEDRVDFHALSSAVASLHNHREPEEVRTESRVSIVEWDEAPRKSRGLEQTSNYQVTEAAAWDYRSIPNEWKHPDDRKVAFGSPSPTNSPRASPNPPQTPAAKNTHSQLDGKENSGVKPKSAKRRPKSGKQQPKVVGGEPVRSDPASDARTLTPRKTWTKDFTILDDFQLCVSQLRKKEIKNEVAIAKEAKSRTPSRAESRASSRASQRPQSGVHRPKSRAAIKKELFGEGVMTKAPSEKLKEVAHMNTAPVNPAMLQYRVGLTDFFTVGVAPPPFEEKELTPRVGQSASKKDTFKISNKIYQLGPRSWRPGSSLADADAAVTDADALSHLDDVGVRHYRMFMESEKDAEEAGSSSTIEFSVSGGIKRQSSQTNCAGSPLPRPPSSRRPTSAGRSPRCRLTTPKPHAAADDMQEASTLPRPPSSRAESGRESRAIVVDGDDMSQYDGDPQRGLHDDDDDDDAALSQLQWELDSTTGGGHGDGGGKTSQLSHFIDDDNADDVNMETELQGRDLITPINSCRDPGFDIQTSLRESDLMDDFEEMEAQIVDEADVKALR